MRRGSRKNLINPLLSLGFFAALACSFSLLTSLYGAVFESNGLGARSACMGSSFAAIPGSYESVFWNPAGIAKLSDKTFHSEYRDLYGLGLLRYFTAGYVHPGIGRGAIGFSWLKLDTVGAASFLDYTENTLVLSYGMEIMSNLCIGINGKFYRVNSSVGAGGQGLDLGVQYTWAGLTLGGAVQDATRTVVTWDSGAKDMIPRRLSLGFSRQFFTNTLLTSQMGWQNETNFSFRQGIEQQMFNKTVNLRLGAIEQNKDWRFAWGVGIRVKIISLDYAWERQRLLGDSQVFSAAIRF